MKRDRSFYERILFRYLAVYGLLHLLAVVLLFNFGGDWGLFIYFLLFCMHIPAMMIASFFAFLGKRFRKSWLWSLACLGFISSNAGWVGMIAQSRGAYYWELLWWSLTTVVPIFASFQLLCLTQEENPKV